MSERKFLSWPPGWRKALPWGCLFGLIIAAALLVAQGLSSGWHTLNAIFCIDLAVLFPFLVVGFTVLPARFIAKTDDKPGAGEES